MRHLLILASLLTSVAVASAQLLQADELRNDHSVSTNNISTGVFRKIFPKPSGEYEVEISGQIEILSEKNDTMNELQRSQIELKNQELRSQVAITKPRSKRQSDRYLQAIDIEATYLDGEAIPMSPQLDCTSGQVCTWELFMKHTEVVRHARAIGSRIEADEILDLISGDSVRGAVAIAETRQSRVNLGPNCVGRVMFKPKLMKITGSLIMREPCVDAGSQVVDSIFSWGMSEADKAPQCDSLGLGAFEIIAPVSITRVSGLHDEQLDGEWYMEYSDNPWPIDEENYHNIRDKDIPNLVDATKVIRSVPNPAACGQFANAYEFKLAIYRNASCYMKHTVGRMEIYTGASGQYVGQIGLAIPHNKYSVSVDEMRKWVENKSCDMIDFDKSIYFCKKFSDSPGAVMMFRRDKTTLLHE